MASNNPPDAIANFDDVNWSTPTSEPEIEKKSIIDEYLEKYRQYIYIAGGFLAVICLCCFYKCCCSDGESEDPEPGMHIRSSKEYN